ncbi:MULTISPECIES: hypothetical protein [unclassified Pseudomonas]|nr:MULTISPECIES: hypothetical protein [unclassified Pseudomonas]
MNSATQEGTKGAHGNLLFFARQGLAVVFCRVLLQSTQSNL